MRGTNRSGEGGEEPAARIWVTTIDISRREQDKKGKDNKWDIYLYSYTITQYVS